MRGRPRRRKAEGLAFSLAILNAKRFSVWAFAASVLRRFYSGENWKRVRRAASGIIKEASKEVKSEEINFD